jgi:DNA primase
MLKTTPAPTQLEQLPAGFIDTVKEKTNIEQVVGRAVELKRSGNNLFGRCPFHSEKSPSFSVSPSKQMYHCFGCGANGDAIGFLMEHGALSFREAVIELAEEARIPLPSTQGARTAPPDLSNMVKANELAGAFFRHCLRHEEVAKQYVRSRKITQEAAKRFLIGYAPDGWQSLEEAFREGYQTSSILIDLGLVIAKEGEGQTQRRYDRFRNRLMFGIRDARGRIMGWGGRSIDASEPKYLNSPQSVLFDKSSQLFGVYEAREAIRQTKQVIVTEGYIDTVANSMAGFAQTVATMGTACTSAHLERLVALAPEIVFSFDGDKAGLAAAWKSLNTCLPFADDTRTFKFLILPPGMDPDEVIQQHGVEAYRQMLQGAKSLSSFMLSHLAQTNEGLLTAENRAKFLAQGNELIQRMPPCNLKRIVKEAFIKASALTPSEIHRMAPSAPNPRQDRETGSAWRTLAMAVTTQRKTAALYAPAMIEQLDQSLQDAFFDNKFDAFPLDQQPFWRAIDACILDDDPVDQDSDISLAQRDLLAKATEILSKQLNKDASQAARAAFRSGQSSEDEFIAHLQGRNHSLSAPPVER